MPLPASLRIAIIPTGGSERKNARARRPPACTYARDRIRHGGVAATPLMTDTEPSELASLSLPKQKCLHLLLLRLPNKPLSIASSLSWACESNSGTRGERKQQGKKAKCEATAAAEAAAAAAPPPPPCWAVHPCAFTAHSLPSHPSQSAVAQRPAAARPLHLRHRPPFSMEPSSSSPNPAHLVCLKHVAETFCHGLRQLGQSIVWRVRGRETGWG